MKEIVDEIKAQVSRAAADRTPLAIHGGNSKAFYGGPIIGDALDIRPYTGIIDYEPKELVLTVRAGTTLTEVEAALSSAQQLLPFEPPQYTTDATIGGTVATGLSGPRRPYTGAVRDFVLGTRIINGKGEDLRFGGRVIKNVAGYDVSRLMTGAMGTLGVLLDISFKVLPIPTAESTLRHEFDEATAIQRFNEWAGKPLPISATSWRNGISMVRLSGTNAGVAAARDKLGGELIEGSEASEFWCDLRDHRAEFFAGDMPLWRLSVPPTCPPLKMNLPQWIEWGGALRWICGLTDPRALRAAMITVGGHATRFRHGDKSSGVFQPMQPVLAKIHRNLKNAFDPANILNRGRMDNF